MTKGMPWAWGHGIRVELHFSYWLYSRNFDTLEPSCGPIVVH